MCNGLCTKRQSPSMLVDLHRRLSKKKVTFPPRTTKSFPLCFVPWLTCHSLFDFAFGTSGYLVYIPWYLVHVFWDTPNQQWLAGYNKRNKYIHVKNGILHSIYWRFWSPFLQGNFTTCLDSSDVKKKQTLENQFRENVICIYICCRHIYSLDAPIRNWFG